VVVVNGLARATVFLPFVLHFLLSPVGASGDVGIGWVRS